MFPILIKKVTISIFPAITKHDLEM